MLKISDFAQIAQISISTLRYYDDIGIFKPVYVDPMTGYRFYAIEQLVRLNRILALKDLGIGLGKIAQLVNENLPPDALHEMLQLRQAQLEQTIEESQEQLARIRARIILIEQEGCSILPEVVLKAVPSTRVLASMTHAEGFIPNLQYAQRFLALLRQHHIEPSGNMIFIYHDNHDQRFNYEYDIELAVPVAIAPIVVEALTCIETITIRQLPAITNMASVLYVGNPYMITHAYQSLGRWVERNHYSITGPCRKCCLHWIGDLDSYITEIQFPININV